MRDRSISQRGSVLPVRNPCLFSIPLPAPVCSLMRAVTDNHVSDLYPCIVDTAFKQQRLKAWQPILTPKSVLPTLFAIGLLFAPIGAVLIWGSNTVSSMAAFSVSLSLTLTRVVLSWLWTCYDPVFRSPRSL